MMPDTGAVVGTLSMQRHSDRSTLIRTSLVHLASPSGNTPAAPPETVRFAPPEYSWAPTEGPRRFSQVHVHTIQGDVYSSAGRSSGDFVNALITGASGTPQPRSSRVQNKSFYPVCGWPFNVALSTWVFKPGAPVRRLQQYLPALRAHRKHDYKAAAVPTDHAGNLLGHVRKQSGDSSHAFLMLGECRKSLTRAVCDADEILNHTAITCPTRIECAIQRETPAGSATSADLSSFDLPQNCHGVLSTVMRNLVTYDLQLLLRFTELVHGALVLLSSACIRVLARGAGCTEVLNSVVEFYSVVAAHLQHLFDGRHPRELKDSYSRIGRLWLPPIPRVLLGEMGLGDCASPVRPVVMRTAAVPAPALEDAGRAGEAIRCMTCERMCPRTYPITVHLEEFPDCRFTAQKTFPLDSETMRSTLFACEQQEGPIWFAAYLHLMSGRHVILREPYSDLKTRAMRMSGTLQYLLGGNGVVVFTLGWWIPDTLPKGLQWHCAEAVLSLDRGGAWESNMTQGKLAAVSNDAAGALLAQRDICGQLARASVVLLVAHPRHEKAARISPHLLAVATSAIGSVVRFSSASARGAAALGVITGGVRHWVYPPFAFHVLDRACSGSTGGVRSAPMTESVMEVLRRTVKISAGTLADLSTGTVELVRDMQVACDAASEALVVGSVQSPSIESVLRAYGTPVVEELPCSRSSSSVAGSGSHLSAGGSVPSGSNSVSTETGALRAQMDVIVDIVARRMLTASSARKDLSDASPPVTVNSELEKAYEVLEKCLQGTPAPDGSGASDNLNPAFIGREECLLLFASCATRLPQNWNAIVALGRALDRSAADGYAVPVACSESHTRAHSVVCSRIQSCC